jgi:hypothetical protein
VSRSIERIYTLMEGDQPELTYGRGIWCAVFGVAAMTLALYLAGRHAPQVVADTEPADEELPPVVWSWRRPPRPDEEEERPPDEPFGLSVSPTSPFLSLSDVRDKPVKRGKEG